jgi:hypothetical protein
VSGSMWSRIEELPRLQLLSRLKQFQQKTRRAPTQSLAFRGQCVRLFQQFANLTVEDVKLLFSNRGKPKRLQVPRHAAHGKKHFCTCVYCAAANRKRESNRKTFLNIDSQIQESSGQRNAAQLRGDLPPIFQLNSGKRALGQVDARSTSRELMRWPPVHLQLHPAVLSGALAVMAAFGNGSRRPV